MKVKIPVVIIATASKHIGDIWVEKLEDFEEAAEKLWKEKDYDIISGNSTNDFDIGDSDIEGIGSGDWEIWKKQAISEQVDNHIDKEYGKDDK